MFLRIFFTIILYNTIYNVQSQDEYSRMTDDALFQLADQAFSMAFRNTDSALLIAGRVGQEGLKRKNNRIVANSWNAAGWSLMHRGRLDSSVLLLEKSTQLFESVNDDASLIRVSINLAEVYTKQSRIAEATRRLLLADSINKKVGNLIHQTNISRQLGILYREAGDNQTSIVYFKQALNGFDKQADYFRYANTGVSLSILYRNMKMPDSSLSLLLRCLEMAKKKPDNQYQIAMIEEHLGETHLEKANNENALRHFNKAYNIFQNLNNKADLAYEAFCIGRTYAKLHQFKKAEEYLLKSYSINDSLKMLNYMLDASGELARLYEQTGKWQKAFQYLQKSSVLKDSLNLADQIGKTNELKEKYETQKKENEIILLKTQNELAIVKNRRTRLLQYAFIVLFAVSLIIGWLLYNRIQIKRKLQEQLLRNQIARDLHDDIGSVLSSIDISSRIALDKKGNSEIILTQLEKIRHHTQQTMESMNDIVWSINPMNDNFENIIMRMRQFASELCEPQSIQLSFTIAPELENIRFAAGRRKDLFLLYKEAVNNAVKHGECSRMGIRFAKEPNNHLLMEITDNGKGFDFESVKRGNGLFNMKTRAQHMNGHLIIETAPGKGTAITLKCPIAN